MGGKRSPGPHNGALEDCLETAGVALGWVRAQADRSADAMKSISEKALASGKSSLLGIIDLFPVKPDSPYSAKLFRHYVEGSGEPYDLGTIPQEWQEWIAKVTKGKPGPHRNLNPYNSGIYDLIYAIGHFDVVVTRQDNPRGTIYEIHDVYEFGYIHNDRNQRGRHGFSLGQISNNKANIIKTFLPSGDQWNPGGFKERWEVVSTGKQTILYIPQKVLAEQGKPFRVFGRFFRAAESSTHAVSSQ